MKQLTPLARLRLQKGLTQEELAEASGVTTRTIQRIESGEVFPQQYTLRRLADALDVDVRELLSEIKDQAVVPTEKPPSLLPLFHALPLFGIVLPFTNILIPFVLWILKKDEHHEYRRQGIQVLNFQLTVTLLACASVALSVLYFPAGFPLMIAVYGYAILFCILNTARTLRQTPVHYPLSIPFFTVV